MRARLDFPKNMPEFDLVQGDWKICMKVVIYSIFCLQSIKKFRYFTKAEINALLKPQRAKFCPCKLNI